MSRRVLLDTNMLVAAYDEAGTTSPEIRERARKRILALLADESVDELVTTPLIRYEVLRGIDWQANPRYQEILQVLQQFREIEVGRKVSELAADLYRFDAWQNAQTGGNKNLEKRKFDVFHLAAAKCNDLELASADTDIAKLEDGLYRQYLQAKGATP